MAAFVVDRLEEVDIHHQQGQRFSAALGPGQFLFEALQEIAAVGSAGQCIGRRQTLQCHIRMFESALHFFLAIHEDKSAGAVKSLEHAVAEDKESAGEDRVRQPPLVIPRFRQQEGKRELGEEGHGEDIQLHQWRRDATPEHDPDTKQGPDDGPVLGDDPQPSAGGTGVH